MNKLNITIIALCAILVFSVVLREAAISGNVVASEEKKNSIVDFAESTEEYQNMRTQTSDIELIYAFACEYGSGADSCKRIGITEKIDRGSWQKDVYWYVCFKAESTYLEFIVQDNGAVKFRHTGNYNMIG